MIKKKMKYSIGIWVGITVALATFLIGIISFGLIIYSDIIYLK